MDELRRHRRKRKLEFHRRQEERRRQEEEQINEPLFLSRTTTATADEVVKKDTDDHGNKNSRSAESRFKENSQTRLKTKKKERVRLDELLFKEEDEEENGKKGASAYPRNLGYPLLLKQSPSSDVSMSQSPSKLWSRRPASVAMNKPAAGAAVRKRLGSGGALSDSGSSSDGDLLAHGAQRRTLAAAGRRSQETLGVNGIAAAAYQPTQKMPPARSQATQKKFRSGLDDSSSDDEESDAWLRASKEQLQKRQSQTVRRRETKTALLFDGKDDIDDSQIGTNSGRATSGPDDWPTRVKASCLGVVKNPKGAAAKSVLDTSSESEADLQELARDMRKRAREKELAVAASRSKDEGDGDDAMEPKSRSNSGANVIKKNSATSRKKLNSMSSSSDDESLSSSDVEAKKPVARTPRNPLAEFRQQNASACRDLQPSMPASLGNGDALWSDSDDNGVPTPVASSEKKKGRGQPIVNGANVLPKDSIEDIIEKNRKKKSRVDLDGVGKDRHQVRALVPKLRHVLEHEEEQLRLELMPDFVHPKFGPYELEPLQLVGLNSGGRHHQVPASISRYLKPYQKEGITFMYNKAIMLKRGVILGDDMGLGKTVQSIALIAALLEKSGTGDDLLKLKRREELINESLAKVDDARQRALAEGRMFLDPNVGVDDMATGLELPEWSPILIVAPNSVTSHWQSDLKAWGHFSCSLYQGTGRDDALKSVNNGLAEIMICAHSMIQRKGDVEKLIQSKPWKLVFVDELHKFKNYETLMSTHLRGLRDAHNCIIIGLTGTVMQNRHKELYNAVDMVADDHFGSWKEFESEYGKPISLSRSSEADAKAVALGEKKSTDLSRLLGELYLRRTKEEVLADDLPKKVERIVFCEPSELQKELYKHIIAQPDFILLSLANAPCDCGVNRKFFVEFQLQRSVKERIAYQRQNRSKLVKRSKCCHPIPLIIPEDGGPSEIDPNAIVWNQSHPTGEPCPQCPHCITFSLIHILYKVSNHISLLQCRNPPEKYAEGSAERMKAEMVLERIKFFIPERVAAQLPGGYFQENGIMDDHSALSGKMAALHKLLQSIQKKHGRTLLFSASTKMLDLIENQLKATGTSFLRLDGQSSNQKRDDTLNEFRINENIPVFLLSTNAFGVGITITEAQYVIIFDVDWNPANDQQAQDRAYRIGQTKEVKVFRLVTRGTIEELKYLRQVYKTQLKSETIINLDETARAKSKRIFRGVEGDTSRKGELFGLENLLKFHDGNFFNYAAKVSESKQFGVDVHGTDDLLEQVQDMDEEELDAIGEAENAFEDLARCTEVKATSSKMDEDEENEFQDEGNLGGMSQTMLEMCGNVPCHKDDEMEDNAVGAPLAREDEEHTISMKALLDAQKRAPSPESSPRNCVHATKASQQKESPGEVGLTFKEEFLPAAEPPIQDNSMYGASEKDTINAEHSVEASFSQRISAIETQSPIDRSSIAMPPLDVADFSPKAKPPPQNIGIVGKTAKGIRNGEAGRTTFSALDLPIPKRQEKRK